MFQTRLKYLMTHQNVGQHKPPFLSNETVSVHDILTVCQRKQPPLGSHNQINVDEQGRWWYTVVCLKQERLKQWTGNEGE